MVIGFTNQSTRSVSGSCSFVDLGFHCILNRQIIMSKNLLFNEMFSMPVISKWK